jgi:hypothetical protein
MEVDVVEDKDGETPSFSLFKSTKKKLRMTELTDAEKEMNLQALKEKYKDHIVYDPSIPIENSYNILNPDAEEGEETEDNLTRKNPGKKSQSAPATSNEVRQTKSTVKVPLKFPPITIKNLNVMQLQSTFEKNEN